MTDDKRRSLVDTWFRLHSGRVLAFLLHRTDADTAHDVLQEVFVAAFRRAEQVPEPALGWLFATARKTLSNSRRSTSRRRGLLDRLGREPRPAHMPAADETVDSDVHAALAQLPVKDREVLTITAWYGLSRAEAAAALSCSIGAYDVRLHRARHRFSLLLDSAGTSPSIVSSRPATEARHV